MKVSRWKPELPSVVLRERRAKTPVHQAEYHRVGQNLSDAAATRRQGQQNTRRQKNEQQHGNPDVKIHLSEAEKEFHPPPIHQVSG